MKYLRLVIIFFLGILLGASLTNMIIGVQIDHLHMSNRSLQQQLSVSERELQSLKESLEEKKKEIITGIETVIKFSGEKLTEYEESSARITIDKQVEEWLKITKGQEIKKLDYMLIPEIIDNREIKIEGRSLGLKVKLVVVTQNLIVYIEAYPVKSEENNKELG
ncbi:MAG: hypothetical protein K9L17_11925 [Clostridiales bacterium]|nr:hypothetical protein [Clostridiales bacterium]MCF8023391.1 hypothetical protein [Clostridiales bacterium]